MPVGDGVPDIPSAARRQFGKCGKFAHRGQIFRRVVEDADPYNERSKNMNDSTYKLIVTLLVLVIVIGGGVLLYNNLQGSVDLGEMVPTETVSENAAPDFTVTDS